MISYLIQFLCKYRKGAAVGVVGTIALFFMILLAIVFGSIFAWIFQYSVLAWTSYLGIDAIGRLPIASIPFIAYFIIGFILPRILDKLIIFIAIITFIFMHFCA